MTPSLVIGDCKTSANGTVFCFTVFVGVISCFWCGRQN